MRVIVWLLTEILRTLLRLEHKTDVLLRQFKTKGELPFVPPMNNQVPDPVTGLPVKYTKVQLTDFGMEVMVRESGDAPTSLDLPQSIRGG